jgi:hypothetical protein
MDIYENRRQWLAHWIEKDFGGDRKKVEMATGYTRSQISQYLSKTYQGGKSPQERAARTLEKKFGKPERIMETPAPKPGEERPELMLKYSGEVPTPAYGATASKMRVATSGGYDELIESVMARTAGAVISGAYKGTSFAAPILPPYVRTAIDALMAAHMANAPREVFDSIRILLSQHIESAESGKIAAQSKDETVTNPDSSMKNIEADAGRAIRDAESRLATRDEGERAAPRTGERKSKGIRH